MTGRKGPLIIMATLKGQIKSLKFAFENLAHSIIISRPEVLGKMRLLEDLSEGNLLFFPLSWVLILLGGDFIHG